MKASYPNCHIKHLEIDASMITRATYSLVSIQSLMPYLNFYKYHPTLLYTETLLVSCMKLFIVRLRRRGQITILAEIRQKLGLVENDELALILRDNYVILRPLNTRIPSKYLKASDDEIEYATIDPEFVPHYYEVKYRDKKA